MHAYLVVLVDLQCPIGVEVTDLEVAHGLLHADPLLPILCSQQVGLHAEIGQALGECDILTHIISTATLLMLVAICGCGECSQRGF